MAKNKRGFGIHCTECGEQNGVLFFKNKKEAEEKHGEKKRYCKNCRKHTPHSPKRIPRPQ